MSESLVVPTALRWIRVVSYVRLQNKPVPKIQSAVPIILWMFSVRWLWIFPTNICVHAIYRYEMYHSAGKSYAPN